MLREATKLIPVYCRVGKNKRNNKSTSTKFETLETRQVLDASGIELEAEPVEIDGQTVNNVDLVALAKAISNSGATFYGAGWCPACTAQKELFGDGGDYLPFVEVTNGDRTLNQIGNDNNISSFPTWVFDSGERIEDVLDIDTLVEKSGVQVPTSVTPYLSEIETINFAAGDPLHIPLNGYSPSGETLTYTVSTAQGAVEATILSGNRSLRFDINGYGNMEFQLFEQRAQRATDRIITLTEQGFYDGLTLHRILDDFVLQGGDPNGNGTGGSNLDDFDDQFHPDLRHNATGILSMAKSFDDTNNSQFFITEGSQRHLDYQHTVFGILTEGENNREAISEIDATPTGTPFVNVVINEATIFNDTENAVLMLDSIPGITGSDEVTVTVTDSSGDSFSRTFQVNISPFSGNNLPYLSDIPDFVVPVGKTTYHQLNSIDADGDNTFYLDENSINNNGGTVPVFSSSGLTYSVDFDNGLLQFTADNTATGDQQFVVATGNTIVNQNVTASLDYQIINVLVSDAPVLNDDVRSIPEDSPLVFNPLDNDTDADGSIDFTSLELVSLPSVGELEVNSDTGVITYTPPADFFGLVTFDYVATDDVGLAGDIATVSIDVLPVNDDPIAVDDRKIADKNSGPIVFDLLWNDSDGAVNDGDTLSILATGPASDGGTVQIINNGTEVQYTPAANFTGTETFSYALYDGTSSKNATVTVEVSDITDFGFSVVKTPTTTNNDGEAVSLPNSVEYVSEWESFVLEVWVSALPNFGTGVQSASLDLDFDSTMFTATSITYGSSITENQTGVIDNLNGTINNLGGETNQAGLGSTSRLLLARIEFDPISTGNGIDAPLFGQQIDLSFDNFITSSNLALQLGGIGTVNSPTTAISPATFFLPNIYDLNDNGRVDLSDVTIFVNQLGLLPTPNRFVDFDASTTIDQFDVELLIQSFGDQFGFDLPTYADTLLEEIRSPDPLMAASMATNFDQSVAPLSEEALTQIASRLFSKISVTGNQVIGPALPVRFEIVDLPDNLLGLTHPNNLIQIDEDAAGFGWFVDETPTTNEEFTFAAEMLQYQAIPGSEADQRIDLVTVIMHELGHLLLLQHTDSGLMSETLEPAVRHLIPEDNLWSREFDLLAVDQIFAELD